VDEFDHIGDYLVRTKKTDPMAEDPLTKYHRVESRVNDSFWLHCGRNMTRLEGTLLIFAVAPPEGQRCKRC